jgi:DNA-binding Xre family transcriptional regulator
MIEMAVRLRIGKLIDAAGITQSELSRRSGISLVTINAMVSGSPRQIQLESIDKLCAALDVDPGELFERDKKRGRKG